MLTVLVTRPLAQAQGWVRQLQAAGIGAQPFPLIDIRPAPDPEPVRQAWALVSASRMVLFVSPNAATHFFALRPESLQDWPSGVQAGSPGPGTTQTLLQLGVPTGLVIEPDPDSPQFDSEALWLQLSRQSWADAQVLLVRGASGRDWLSEKLRSQGAVVHAICAYDRVAPNLDPAQRTLLGRALADPDQYLWHFSSSEAIDHLAALAPDASWGASRALATHPRIAARARGLGMGEVHEARPGLEAVVACIQSLSSLKTR